MNKHQKIKEPRNTELHLMDSHGVKLTLGEHDFFGISRNRVPSKKSPVTTCEGFASAPW